MGPELLGGRYELRGVLGRGGMAEVRDGWDTRLGRAVAIKLLHPALSTDPDDRRRFEAEARSAAALNHPHIVAVHDSGEHRGTPFIVMERLPGYTLADLIARGPLPQPQVRRMLNDVLAALALAHSAGILHRDIKPGNILFTTFGHTKVADFGIAKTAQADLTRTGQIMGTMAYLSPDRVAGKPATIGDDLYAVGVVGYEALTAHKPFPQDNLGALARAIMVGRPLPVSALRPDVDPVMAHVVERSMAAAPERRFVSAEAMRAGLAATGGEPLAAPVRPPTLVLTTPVSAVLPPSMAYAPYHPPSARRAWLGRTRILVGLTATVAAIALAALAFGLDSAPHTTVPNQPATTSPLVPTPVSTSPITPFPTPTTNPSNPHGDDHGDGKGKGKGRGRGGDD